MYPNGRQSFFPILELENGHPEFVCKKIYIDVSKHCRLLGVNFSKMHYMQTF
jgi:hypothetical protein